MYTGIIKKQTFALPPSRSQLDDSEASVTLHETRGTYNIVVHRVVSHDEIPAPEVRFGCELSIPGTDYRVREESVYEHSGGGTGE